MDFAAPNVLWLLLASPLATALVWWIWRQRMAAVAAWSARGLWDRLLPTYRSGRQHVAAILLGAVLATLILALSRPRWGSVEQTVERSGVDVVFVLDTSLSMATRDVQPSRLWVAQSLIRELVRRLPGERVALVQSEGDGVVMAPLTVDSAVVDMLLDAVAPGSLPTPGTALAPGLARAVELFPEGSEGHRVIIVLSDGEDHGSDLTRALGTLEEAEVKVHAIGVGTPEGQPLELPQATAGRGGRPVEYKTDEKGNVVVSRLEERNLERLARETGGIYIRATSAAADVGGIVARIDRMARRTLGEETVTALEERFQLPALLTLVALGVYLALPVFGRDDRKYPA